MACGFHAVDPSTADEVVIPDGFVAQVLIPWGDPIVPGGPAFRFDGANTAAEQAEQFGMGHDGMHFFPLYKRRGLLVVNHEAVDNTIMFNAEPDWSDVETVLRSQNAARRGGLRDRAAPRPMVGGAQQARPAGSPPTRRWS